MILIDSDIKNYDFSIPSKQTKLFRIIEKLKGVLKENDIVTSFSSPFIEEISICFYLGGFNVLADSNSNHLNADNIYYVSSLIEKKPNKIIFFSRSNDYDFSNYKKAIVLILTEEEKWKMKIK